jgi:hypothetical protein
MSFYVGGRETEIDRASDVEALTARLPRYKQNLEVIKDIRVAQAECARIDQNSVVMGMTKTRQDGIGMMQVAAGIPWSLWAKISEQYPGFWQDKKSVYKWLKRHPEYRTGQTIIRA